MKKGFTLLELLIASLLLSMLVTILTQLFSQSSIAWRTGESGIVELDQKRADISALQRDADNAIMRNNEPRRLCGIWDKESGGLMKRGFLENTKWESSRFSSDMVKSPQRWAGITVSQQGSGGEKIKNYLVGVTSAGPDGVFDTWDDITSWPTDE